MTSIVEPRTGILLVCSLKDEPFIRGFLDEHALTGWKDTVYVKVMALPWHLFRDVGHIKSKIKSCVKQSNPAGYYNIYVYGISADRACLADRDDRDRWTISYCGSDPNIVRNKLKKGLRELRLDWFSQVANSLSNAWLRAKIEEDHIENWLRQFDLLGEHSWVGKKLLQSLDFWPEARVIDALDITPEKLHGFDQLCLSTEKVGKSADVLRNLVAKRLSTFDKGINIPGINEPKSCIDKPEKSNILWAEDCLLTATEVTSLIRALLGLTPKGRKPKTTPMSDPANLLNKYLQFRFALVTDFGLEKLKKILEENGLGTWEVSFHDHLEVLTYEGVEALSNNSFYLDKEQRLVKRLKSYIKMPAFSNNEIWQNQTERNKAITFCSKIGRQLFSNYVNKQVEHRGWDAWAKMRIDQCALGMNGFGLALAFGHTIPKSSLPLFWGSGDVFISTRKRKSKIRWEPLFPGTD